METYQNPDPATLGSPDPNKTISPAISECNLVQSRGRLGAPRQ